MTGTKRLAVVPLLVLLSAGTTSCELVESCLECMCGDVNQGQSGITGNPKVDSFFAATVALDQSTRLADEEMEEALADLRVTLDLPPDASVADIRAEIDAAFSEAGVGFNATYEPAECHGNMDVAARAAAECDVDVEPGEVDVRCEGTCEGTCQASCEGECRLPSVDAYCEGTCHGQCRVDVDGACYGTCRGTCDGTCSVEDASGDCAGSCDGTCTGYCDVTVEGSCTGECHGECAVVVTEGECNARCEGTCQGHCEGSCDGEVVPPSVDAECQAQVEARVDASVECDPPRLDFGVDTSGVEDIARITHGLGRVLAVSAEAEIILQGIQDYVVEMQSAAEAVINGEVADNKLVCALAELNDAVTILQNAVETLDGIVTVQATLIL